MGSLVNSLRRTSPHVALAGRSRLQRSRPSIGEPRVVNHPRGKEATGDVGARKERPFFPAVYHI